ncbi:hypothetical protein J5N97_025406 [Dioscorea zingiberensis]|uniref:Cytochrome P450 n=1 Tax=Dioscorea zingiberensis TaxID=325984 RepID=A0A9D5C986_9LILI|nr:hypothetical protein J5N97_025406 [Dioscorea zingiberensis]
MRELLNATNPRLFPHTAPAGGDTHGKRNCNRRTGVPVDMGQMVFVTSFNVITAMLWGNSLVAEELERIRVEFREVVIGIVDLLGVTNVSDIFPILERMDLQGVQRKMKQHKEKLDGLLSTVIDRRERTVNTSGAQKAQDFLQNIIVGGIDTTSTTIEWAMAEMIDKPEKQSEKHRKEELDSVVGKEKIVDLITSTKIALSGGIGERSTPFTSTNPTLLLPRYPTATCNIGGYTIPKGTKVFINVWSIHRDPGCLGKPVGIQARKVSSRNGQMHYYGNNFNFIPFGSGRRICVGIPLVEKMSLHILATMLHCFDWSLPDGMKLDLVEKFGIVLKKEKQLVAIPTARPSCAKLGK